MSKYYLNHRKIGNRRNILERIVNSPYFSKTAIEDRMEYINELQTLIIMDTIRVIYALKRKDY